MSGRSKTEPKLRVWTTMRGAIAHIHLGKYHLSVTPYVLTANDIAVPDGANSLESAYEETGGQAKATMQRLVDYMEWQASFAKQIADEGGVGEQRVVDRTGEQDFGDSEIVVTLSDGFSVRFFEPRLLDAEYIRRAEEIRSIENGTSESTNQECCPGSQ